jgi:molybdate transport system substrate-binding protein
VRRALPCLALVLLSACGSSSVGASPPDPVAGTVSVFAASSLTDAFNREATAFKARHRTVTVRLNFAGSALLATQISQGAPADVFASADQANLAKVSTAGPATVFATNELQVAVAPGNPKGIHGLSDLAKPGLTVVLCAAAVPCGVYANRALLGAGVKLTPKSQEQDVRGVLSKVGLGEADAGIVYVTDIRSAGDKVDGVEIPPDQNVIATYPIAAITGSSNPRAGQAFVNFVLSPTGQAILADYGFGKP